MTFENDFRDAVRVVGALSVPPLEPAKKGKKKGEEDEGADAAMDTEPLSAYIELRSGTGACGAT